MPLNHKISGFHRLAGNKTLEKQIESGLSEVEIRVTWQEGLALSLRCLTSLLKIFISSRYIL